MYEFGKLFERNKLGLGLLQNSFSPELNQKEVFKMGEGSGKSGSFFLLTHDKRFMIKTIKKSELNIMLQMLPRYIDHNLQYPESLIGKIFGVFTVKRAGSSPIYLALMENTTQYDPKMLRYKFDLKGSTYMRKTKGLITSNTDRKDLDLLELKEEKTKLLKISTINRHILKILRRDINFLKNQGLIDYSLLLAIEISTKKFKPQKLIEKRMESAWFSFDISK